MALIALLIFQTISIVFAAVNPFSDVPKGHWAYNSVKFTSKLGINKGYEDNTFRVMIARVTAYKNFFN